MPTSQPLPNPEVMRHWPRHGALLLQHAQPCQAVDRQPPDTARHAQHSMTPGTCQTSTRMRRPACVEHIHANKLQNVLRHTAGPATAGRWPANALSSTPHRSATRHHQHCYPTHVQQQHWGALHQAARTQLPGLNTNQKAVLRRSSKPCSGLRGDTCTGHLR